MPFLTRTFRLRIFIMILARNGLIVVVKHVVEYAMLDGQQTGGFSKVLTVSFVGFRQLRRFPSASVDNCLCLN